MRLFHGCRDGRHIDESVITAERSVQARRGQGAPRWRTFLTQGAFQQREAVVGRVRKTQSRRGALHHLGRVTRASSVVRMARRRAIVGPPSRKAGWLRDDALRLLYHIEGGISDDRSAFDAYVGIGLIEPLYRAYLLTQRAGGGLHASTPGMDGEQRASLGEAAAGHVLR